MCGGTQGASDLGAGEGAGVAAAARPWNLLACGKHDWRVVRPRGADGEATAAAAQSALECPVCALRCRQRRVVHGLQGLVSHWRWEPLRAVDAERCVQPLFP